jgi:DNA replication protein DnaC
MNEALLAQLKYLRLGGLLAHWDEYLHLAADKNFSHGHLLTHVVEEEYRLKQAHARAFRRLCARIPEPWVIETFPFERQPKLNRKKIMALYDSGQYLHDHQNIIWLGGTGYGKTGLATSFLIHALDQGYRGRYVRFDQLVDEFYRSAADHSEEKVLKSYLAWDCLLIDEIGYVEVEPAQVGLFFMLMHRRHKKKPTLITSNLGFSEWGSFLKNDHLSAALIDRLTENSHVFNMKGGVTLRPPLISEP